MNGTLSRCSPYAFTMYEMESLRLANASKSAFKLDSARPRRPKEDWLCIYLVYLPPGIEFCLHSLWPCVGSTSWKPSDAIANASSIAAGNPMQARFQETEDSRDRELNVFGPIATISELFSRGLSGSPIVDKCASFHTSSVE